MAQFEKYVSAAELMIHSKQSRDQILQMLGRGDAQAIARVVTFIVTELDDQVGGEIPEEEVLPLAQEVIDMVLELAQAVGVQVDQNAAQEAAQRAVQGLMEHYGTTQEHVQGMMQEIGPETAQQFGGMQNGGPTQ